METLEWTVTVSGVPVSWAADMEDGCVARIITAYRTKLNIDPATTDDEVKHLVIQNALSRMLEDTYVEEVRAAQRAAGDAVERIEATPQE